MTRVLLITGGQRSGKSQYAEQLALSLSPNPIYVATARVFDEEFRQRVALHRASSPQLLSTRCIGRLPYVVGHQLFLRPQRVYRASPSCPTRAVGGSLCPRGCYLYLCHQRTRAGWRLSQCHAAQIYRLTGEPQSDRCTPSRRGHSDGIRHPCTH